MSVHTLKLERFRGAETLTLELHERLNVFISMNGEGKSTVLDAAAMLLSWLVNRIKQPGASGRPIPEADIKNGKSSANLEITLDYGDRRFRWNIAKARKGRDKKQIASDLHHAKEAARLIASAIETSDEQGNLPLFVYYPVNRAVLDIPLRNLHTNRNDDRLSAYDESLTDSANFRPFFEWFREREDREKEHPNEEYACSGPYGYTFPDWQLEPVRDAMARFLPSFQDLTIRRNPLRMEVTKHGKALTVNQLSGGEKCLMAMVGDLARRLAIANPWLENPLEGEGVVLIDEIDLHLHPAWQRTLVPTLMEAFPRCQFLITTHSPHIVTHVHPEHLFLLTLTDKGLESVRPTESYGKSAERILEDLMGLETTRPADVAMDIHQIYKQIDQGLFDAAKDSIRQLQSRIGQDPEQVKAGVLITRKELLGK